MNSERKGICERNGTSLEREGTCRRIYTIFEIERIKGIQYLIKIILLMQYTACPIGRPQHSDGGP